MLGTLLLGASLAAAAPVKLGVDALRDSGFAALQGKRVGVLTNHTGRDSAGRSTVELLAEAPGVELVAVFSPEHGFTGASEENRIPGGKVRLGGREVPVHSLYTGGIAGMRPKPEQLAGLDALVFDIQDIGARFYTYLASMAMALEETAKADIEFVVLDRPNPIGGTLMEGPLLEHLELRRVTPTAYFPVPVRHGMTAGEIALLHNAEVGHPRLTVVKVQGWKRTMWYDETGLPWIPPSPNMPDIEAAALYPGVGIFESSNLSVGRGTPAPFRWVGAPWMDAEAVARRLRAAKLPGVEFSVESYTPDKSVFAGQACRGVRMKVVDRRRLRPTLVFLHLNAALRELHPDKLVWRWDENKRMTGTERFRALHEAGDLRGLRRLFDSGPSAFAARRRPFLLY